MRFLLALLGLLGPSSAAAQFSALADPLPSESLSENGEVHGAIPDTASADRVDTLSTGLGLGHSAVHPLEISGNTPFEVVLASPSIADMDLVIESPSGEWYDRADWWSSATELRIVVGAPERGEWTLYVEALRPVEYRLRHQALEPDALAEAFERAEVADSLLGQVDLLRGMADSLLGRTGLLWGMADSLHPGGGHGKAELLAGEAIVTLETLLGPEHYMISATLLDFAAALREGGEPAAARPLYERALEAVEARHGLYHPESMMALSGLTETLMAEGEFDAARPLYERALEAVEALCGPYHPLASAVLVGLAEALEAQGLPAAALPLVERARTIRGGERMELPAPEAMTAECPEIQGASLSFFGSEPSPLVRYPSIEMPARVARGERFSVLVSLTEAPGAAIADVSMGQTSESGALALSVGGTYDVVLHARGFDLESNTQRLVVFDEGDSTPARFVLTPEPGTTGPRDLHATLFQPDGAFAARFSRGVCVGECTGASPNAAAATEEPRGAPSLPGRALAPDLTIVVTYGQNPDHPRQAQVTVSAGSLPLRTDTWDEPEGAEAWIRTQLSRLAALSARGPDVAVDSSRSLVTAEGVGEELWRRFAPPIVQETFWALADAEVTGWSPFEAIQVVSNDALVPWELMRPSREGEARGFLGTEFEVGRWHVEGARPRRALRPPQVVAVDGLTLLAPAYEGSATLPAQAAERRALLSRTGAAEAEATFDGLRALLASPPPHIVHFAGHGAVRPAPGGGHSQVVLLEDGAVDLIDWAGMLTRAPHGPPFVFFNACEVGQTNAAAGFVTGWAPTVLDAGAAGYVGALWPVGDQAAAEFAEAFYRHLYADTPERGRVAAALRRARAERFVATADPTHLAYVYYGDPFQRLELPE